MAGRLKAEEIGLCVWRSWIACLVVGLWLAALCVPVWSTALGLNQISTPDIQPLGVLSVSFQNENPALGNPQQIQLELGITKAFEVAVFQGLSPVKTVLNAEVTLVDKRPFLLSAGLLGTQNATRYQPFLEAGYYPGKAEYIAGIQRQDGLNVGVFGVAYQVLPKVRLAADYISGSSNFATVGFTYQITPNFSFNPALYVSNAEPHRLFCYGVVTWEVKVW